LDDSEKPPLQAVRLSSPAAIKRCLIDISLLSNLVECLDPMGC
jgi:hypothetical protein